MPDGARLDFRLVPSATTTPPPAAASDAVVVSGLAKRYGRREAVRGLDLAAPRGAVTAILGPNGAGKTTTVECCEGLRRPDGGSVRVLGLDPLRDARALRPRVGVMLQDGGLPSTVPAAEALRHVAAMYSAPRDVRELTARLGLAPFARTPVRRLSGGERQRLALAVALVGAPEVVFLDEPSAGMDPQSRLAVWALIRELRAQGTTILLTTHQMAEAEELADHVVIVDHGRVLAAGATPDLLGDSATVRVTLRPLTGADEVDDATADALERRLRSSLGDPEGTRAVGVARGAGSGTLEIHAGPDPALLHAVTGWAQDSGLLVTSLTTGTRTLEDVFLELTGRSLR